MPKHAIAAGLAGISQRELSLKHPWNKRRTLSVFSDYHPPLHKSTPKPPVQRPLQDVTDHYYSQINAQPCALPSQGKTEVMIVNTSSYDDDHDKGLAQFDTAVPAPLVDNHFVIPLDGSSELTLDPSGDSVVMDTSSPLTSPELTRRQSTGIINSSPKSSPMMTDCQNHHHPRPNSRLSRKQQLASGMAYQNSVNPQDLGISVAGKPKSPSSLLSQ